MAGFIKIERETCLSALEYAYRHAARYQVVWWIRSEDQKTLAAEYALPAHGADLPESEGAGYQAKAAGP